MLYTSAVSPSSTKAMLKTANASVIYGATVFLKIHKVKITLRYLQKRAPKNAAH